MPAAARRFVRAFVLWPVQRKEFCKIACFAARGFMCPRAIVAEGAASERFSISDIAVRSAGEAVSKNRLTEDWLTVVIGVLVFALALFSVSGTDLLGWAVTTSVYADVTKALAPVAKAYPSVGGLGGLVATYASLLVALSAGIAALGGHVRKFAVAFTVVFAIAYASWIVGSYAYVAAVTPAEQEKFGISWSLKLTNEGGFVVALAAGLVIANFFSALCGLAEGSDSPRTLYQDSDRHPRRNCRGHRRRPAQSGVLDPVARRCRDHRGLSDLLVGGLFRGAQMVRLQPRMVGAAHLRHLELRRRCGDCDGRRHPRPSCRADPGLVAGRGLRPVALASRDWLDLCAGLSVLKHGGDMGRQPMALRTDVGNGVDFPECGARQRPDREDPGGRFARLTDERTIVPGVQADP
jgi:hypothetical protein